MGQQHLTARKRDAVLVAADRSREAQKEAAAARLDLERALVNAHAEGRSLRQLERLSGLPRMTIARLLEKHRRWDEAAETAKADPRSFEDRLVEALERDTGTNRTRRAHGP